MDRAARRRSAFARAWRLSVAAVVALPGALTLLGALARVDPWHGQMALNAPVRSVCFTRVLAIAAGGGLLVLARGLVQGKRRAAEATIGVLCTVAIVRLSRDLSDGPTVAAVGLAGLLLATRRAFPRGSDARPGLLAGSVALGTVATAYVVATAATLLTSRASGLGAALAAEAAGRLQSAARNPETPLGLGLDALALVGLGAGALFVYQLLRPAPADDGHSPSDHAAAARRVARHGWTVEVVPDPELDPATGGELDAVERAWRASRPRIQGWAMTLGRLWGAGGDVGGIYVLARNPAGRLRAFLRFVEYGRGL